MLTLKLVRDVRRLSGQVATTAFVVAAGVASYVAMTSTGHSLGTSRDSYYRDFRFGDVFAQLERAPLSVHAELEAIPGVAVTHSRVAIPIRLPIPGTVPPPFGRLVSIPEEGRPALNAHALVRGREPRGGAADEVLLLEAFAETHGVEVGESLPVVIEGRRTDLRVVGIATSPEFVYPVAPGASQIPDDERFAVLWMRRDAAAFAAGMEGAFNDVVLRLSRGASEAAVLEHVDRILEPYGGFRSVGRADQPSNLYLQGELDQLESFGRVLPAIFLSVAAFILNVVLSRLVQIQRPQVAALKALGYSDVRIGLHYLALASTMVTGGVLLGSGVGAWLGKGLTDLYTRSFGIPLLDYGVDSGVLVVGAVVSLLAGAVGALTSVSSIVRLPPAEAMRAAPPASYRPTLLERSGIQNLFGMSGRMVFREVGRRPIRMGLSIVGIAAAMGILIVGQFTGDAMDLMMDVQFTRAWRDDVMVSLVRPTPERAVRELGHLPGVVRAEGMRIAPVEFTHGHRAREAVLYGTPPDGELRRVLDREGNAHPVRPGGVTLTRKLAELLEVEPNEFVRAEVLVGERRELRLPVVGVVEEMMGLQGYMPLAELNAALDEAPTVSAIFLSSTDQDPAELFERLSDHPAVVDATTNAALIRRFREQSAAILGTMTLISTLFAAAIAVGVVYNNARVSLSVRSRDLASLRVLGFSQREVGSVLVGELVVQFIGAIPLGILFGSLLARGIANSVDPERFRLPPIVSNETIAFATITILVAAVFSAALVLRKLNQLDLIGVLKTRE